MPGAGNAEMPVEERVKRSIDKALDQVERRRGRLLVYGWATEAWNGRRALIAGWGYRLEDVGTLATGTVDALTR